MSDLVLTICHASCDVFSLYRFEGLDDNESSAIAAKCYELCNAAANHITSIGKSLEFIFCRYLANDCTN